MFWQATAAVYADLDCAGAPCVIFFPSTLTQLVLCALNIPGGG